MHNSLLRSFIVVTVFWSLVAWVLFGFSSVETNLQAAKAVAALPFATEVIFPERANLFDAAALQGYVFSHWTLVLLSIGATLAVVGGLIAYYYLERRERERKGREAPDRAYAGIQVSLGWMPKPEQLNRASAHLDLGIDLTPEEGSLLDEIMGTLAAYPDAFVGDGHGVDLATHTLNVIESLVEQGTLDGLALLAAAAHDLGKITSYEKDGDSWVRLKLHDKESARLLATLPSFLLLPELPRQALILATAYGHAPETMPETEASELARRILGKAHQADCDATKNEKARVLEAVVDKPDIVMQAFLDVLSVLPMQSPGLPKKVPAAGWRVKDRAWFLEWRLREEAMKRLPPDVRAAMGGDWRDRQRLAPYMIALLNELGARGWLVSKVGEWECPAEHSLWKVRAGIKEFNGVFGVDLPAEYLPRLPGETAYAFEVLGPQLAQVNAPVEDFAGVNLFKDEGTEVKVPKLARTTPKNAPSSAAEEGLGLTPPVVADISESLALDAALLDAFEADEVSVPPPLLDATAPSAPAAPRVKSVPPNSGPTKVKRPVPGSPPRAGGVGASPVPPVPASTASPSTLAGAKLEPAPEAKPVGATAETIQPRKVKAKRASADPFDPTHLGFLRD